MMNWQNKSGWNLKQKDEGKDLTIKEVKFTLDALNEEIIRIDSNVRIACELNDYITLKRLINVRSSLVDSFQQINEHYQAEISKDVSIKSNIVQFSKLSVSKIHDIMSMGYKKAEISSLSLASVSLTKTIELIESSSEVHLKINRFIVNQSTDVLKEVSNLITKQSNKHL